LTKKGQLSWQEFDVFEYKQKFSITINHNFSKRKTAMQQVNKITQALFGFDRFTKEMLDHAR